MPKIVYDRKNCDGHFICVTLDPESFEEDEEGGEEKATLLGASEVQPGLWTKTIREEDVEDAVQAAAGCPADVIKVLDDDGNVLEGPKLLPIEQ